MLISRRVLPYLVLAAGVTFSSAPQRAPATLSATHSQQQQQQQLLEAITAELLPVEEAQKLRVYKFSKFFSSDDIQCILAFKHQHRQSLGTTRRGSTGMKALDSPWVTTYLSTNNLLEKQHPELVQRLVQAAVDADEAQGWGILSPPPGASTSTSPAAVRGRLNFRVMELHDVEAGGALSDTRHFDGGSLLTLDVMLSSPGQDFDGGSFSTPESDGSVTRHDFGRGDLLVFPSHKFHFVQPVSAGHRSVLVLELWRGESRGCAHRCAQHLGSCDYSAARSTLDTILQASMPEVDPW